MDEGFEEEWSLPAMTMLAFRHSNNSNSPLKMRKFSNEGVSCRLYDF